MNFYHSLFNLKLAMSWKLNAFITDQATMIAYIDDFKIMMIITLAIIPLLLLLSRPKNTLVKNAQVTLE